MVEAWVALSLRAGGQLLREAGGLERCDKGLVVGAVVGRTGRAELREAPSRLGARRDVQVVAVHDGIRRSDDQRIRQFHLFVDFRHIVLPETAVVFPRKSGVAADAGIDLVIRDWNQFDLVLR